MILVGYIITATALFLAWLLPDIQVNGNSADVIWISAECYLLKIVIFDKKIQKLPHNLLIGVLSLLLFFISIDEFKTYQKAYNEFNIFVALHGKRLSVVDLQKDGWQMKNMNVWVKYVHGMGATWKLVYRDVGVNDYSLTMVGHRVVIGTDKLIGVMPRPS
jgi:hypothetical protein